MNIKKLSFSALATALVFLGTYLIKIPLPIGYIHLGDGFILALSYVLGPWMILPSAIGSMLADLIAGYAIYTIPTFLIKGLMVLVLVLPKFPSTTKIIIFKFVLAELVMILSYFIFQIFAYSFNVALAEMPFNFIQAIGGIVFGLMMTIAFKSRNFKI